MHRLLHAPIGATLARLAAPNVISMAVMALMSVAEGVFAGMLGLDALAGLALVFPFVMLVQMLSGGALGGAVSAVAAQTLGAGDAPAAARLVWSVWALATAAGAATALAMALLGAPLFRLLGGEGAALEAALDYASGLFPLCIGLWLCQISLAAIRGAGDMGTPALIQLGASLGTVPLSGALAFGWGPFPALGMTGLGLGLALSFGGGAAAAVWWLLSGRAGLAVAGALRGPARAPAGRILRIGATSAISPVQTVVTIVAMVALVGRFGPEALAGYGLAARLEFLMIPVAFGIGTAMTAMVGANIGAGARARAVRVAWSGSCAAAALVGAVGLVMWAAPGLWLDLFLPPGPGPARAAAEAYFAVAGPCLWAFALGLALYFAAQGAGRPAWPVAAGFARLAVAVGGGALILSDPAAGLQALFGAVAAGMLVYGGICAAWLAVTRWR